MVEKGSAGLEIARAASTVPFNNFCKLYYSCIEMHPRQVAVLHIVKHTGVVGYVPSFRSSWQLAHTDRFWRAYNDLLFLAFRIVHYLLNFQEQIHPPLEFL